MHEVVLLMVLAAGFANSASGAQDSDAFRAIYEKEWAFRMSEFPLLAHASYYAKKIDGRMPMMFGHLPRQPYGVAPVPEELAPFYTGRRYVPAPLDAHRGGYYWVNTYALESRPLYVIPAQALSYKLGEYTLLQLRSKAEREFAAEFDIRAFHDFVLSLGSVPLDVLTDEVDASIRERR